MAETITIARPYAEALFSLAKKQKQLVEWEAVLQRLASVMRHANLAAWVDNPRFTHEQVETLLSSLLEGTVNLQTHNLLNILIANNRLHLLPEIDFLYQKLKAEHESTVDAVVNSAHPLNKAQLKLLSERLEKRFARKINISTHIEPELLGGVKIVVGDEVIDASVRGKLQAMAIEIRN